MEKIKETPQYIVGREAATGQYYIYNKFKGQFVGWYGSAQEALNKLRDWRAI